MSAPAKPRILVLDPDSDFLEGIIDEGHSREADIYTPPYSLKDKPSLEELILHLFPDIVVINLDVDDELKFASSVLEIIRVPLPIPPIVFGTTSREGLSFKQLAYANGIDDYQVRPFSPKDVWLRLDVLLRTRRLQIQLDQTSRKLSNLNAQLSDSNKTLEEMTITDELTGLNNMRFMTQYLDKQFHLFSRYKRPFSLMMIDLDHFKEVNDKNDHLLGSETIRRVGGIIHQSTRNSDIKARFGGDEYIIALPETEGMAAFKLADRIREAIEKMEIVGRDGKSFCISASIGVGTFDTNLHKKYEDIVRDADYALYVAKANGRNRVILSSDISSSISSSISADTGGDAKSDKKTYDENQSSVLSEIKKLVGSG